MENEKKQIIDEADLAQVNGGTSVVPGTDDLSAMEAMQKQAEQAKEDFRADYKAALEKIDRAHEVLEESLKNFMENGKL